MLYVHELYNDNVDYLFNYITSVVVVVIIICSSCQLVIIILGNRILLCFNY